MIGRFLRPAGWLLAGLGVSGLVFCGDSAPGEVRPAFVPTVRFSMLYDPMNEYGEVAPVLHPAWVHVGVDGPLRPRATYPGESSREVGSALAGVLLRTSSAYDRFPNDAPAWRRTAGLRLSAFAFAALACVVGAVVRACLAGRGRSDAERPRGTVRALATPWVASAGVLGAGLVATEVQQTFEPPGHQPTVKVRVVTGSEVGSDIGPAPARTVRMSVFLPDWLRPGGKSSWRVGSEAWFGASAESEWNSMYCNVVLTAGLPLLAIPAGANVVQWVRRVRRRRSAGPRAGTIPP